MAALRTRPRLAALRRAWPLGLALFVIAVIASGLCYSRPGRAATLSAFFLPDMLVELPVRPVTWITETPVVERVRIPYPGGSIVADVYRPPDRDRHAAIIFSMGAPPLDLDDPRLVKLAEDAARAGLVMVVPFSERLDAERIEVEEIDALIGVFEFVHRQPYVRADRVGYIGVSVGGSLALVAAADERIAGRVAFVVAFGAYYNALDTLTAIGSRRLRYNGLAQPWEPDPHSVEVMALQLINDLSDADDRATLCTIFVDAHDQHLCDATGSDVGVGGLTSEGRAAYEVLTSDDPARAGALLDELPPSLIVRLQRLSPSQTLDGLRAEVYLIHDRGDAFIPYVESRRLRDALRERVELHFTEVSLFEHVEPRLGRGGDVLVLDGTRLYFQLYQLLLDLS